MNEDPEQISLVHSSSAGSLSAGTTTATSDALGRALLAGLVGFIRPYIDAYATVALAEGTGAKDSRYDQTAAYFDLRAERACSGAHGKELLSALGMFVKDLTAPAGDITAKGPGELAMVATDSATQDREPIPHEQQDLVDNPRDFIFLGVDNYYTNSPSAMIIQTQQFVFNEMPIRMLAFDSNGSQLRLVERAEIVEEIKSRIWDSACQKAGTIIDEYDLPNLVKKLGRYAILSHTWFRGNPSDVVYSNWKDRELNPEGNGKIINFCKVAACEYGVRYGWMDTVCIDKGSSTELDESIRSMYRWYQQSHICITYLADTSDIPSMHNDTWFTRGWTLQELLAPRNMAFYSKNWTFLAQNDRKTKKHYRKFNTFSEATHAQIFQATTIESDEMAMCFGDPTLLPISRVFELASLRKVTREEDRVYSLMGLLGVSIPVAYGEGLPAAFRHLVREIMVTKDNFLDVFNHSDKTKLIPDDITQYKERCSLFDQTSSHESTKLHWYLPIQPITMTHLGVHIPILLVPLFHAELITGTLASSETHPLSVSIPRLGRDNYYVLKQNDISANFIASLRITQPGFFRMPDVTFCGILNFWRLGSGYQTSDRWLYVTFELLESESEYMPKLITDIDPRDLHQMSGPLVQLWESGEHSPGYEEIQQQDLRKMGMQVSTLYLR